MADPVAVIPTNPVVVSLSDPMQAGETTSEGKMAHMNQWIGVAITVLGALESLLQGLTTALPASPAWLGPAIMVIGVALKLATQFGYTQSRTAIKVASLSSAEATEVLGKE